ncbi:MAG: hypothetical protein LBB76_10830 [Azoarcus sp.]|nr:hypothetical protein [Azoarcus sp.]
MKAYFELPAAILEQGKIRQQSMTYLLEPITNDDLSQILADVKTHPEADAMVSHAFPDGPNRHDWAIDRQSGSYLIRCLHDPEQAYTGYLFFYRGHVYTVFLNRDRHWCDGIEGWVSMDSEFKSLPPEDPEFRQALSKACDVLWKGVFNDRIMVFGSSPSANHSGVTMTYINGDAMTYVCKPIHDDDLPRIIADAKSHPKLEVSIPRKFSDGPNHYCWAVDRQNDSYLIGCFYNPKCCYDGYMFFYQGNAYTVFVNQNRHMRNGIEGWVSMDQEFKSLPPEDPGFRYALSKACNVLRGGRLLGKVVFDMKQQEEQ